VALVLVVGSWYVALVAESYRMDFPVGILNTPNLFCQVLTLLLIVYIHGYWCIHGICIRVLILIQVRVRVRAVVVGKWTNTYEVSFIF
jgi:hypothetical protein